MPGQAGVHGVPFVPKVREHVMLSSSRQAESQPGACLKTSVKTATTARVGVPGE